MGETDGCSEFCTVFILTLSRMAGAILGGLFISYYAFITLPMSIIAGFYLCDIYLAKNATTKNTIAYLIIMALLYNIAWIFALRDHDSNYPIFAYGKYWWLYLVMLVNTYLDFYFVKKRLHKWGHRWTKEELRKESKDLKRQKKSLKLQQMEMAMVNMSTYEREGWLKKNGLDRRMWEKEQARIQQVKIYQKMQQ